MGGANMAEEPIQTAPAKPFYLSSTLWINVIGVIIIVIQSLIANNSIVDKDVVAILMAITNILNRFRNTSQPLTIK